MNAIKLYNKEKDTVTSLNTVSDKNISLNLPDKSSIIRALINSENDVYFKIGTSIRDADFETIEDCLKHLDCIKRQGTKQKAHTIFLQLENNYTITKPIYIEDFYTNVYITSIDSDGSRKGTININLENSGSLIYSGRRNGHPPGIINVTLNVNINTHNSVEWLFISQEGASTKIENSIVNINVQGNSATTSFGLFHTGVSSYTRIWDSTINIAIEETSKYESLRVLDCHWGGINDIVRTNFNIENRSNSLSGLQLAFTDINSRTNISSVTMNIIDNTNTISDCFIASGKTSYIYFLGKINFNTNGTKTMYSLFRAHRSGHLDVNAECSFSKAKFNNIFFLSNSGIINNEKFTFSTTSGNPYVLDKANIPPGVYTEHGFINKTF